MVNMRGLASTGGGTDKPALRAHTPRDPYSTDLEIGARLFVSACAALPFVIFGICLAIIRFLS